MTQYIDNMIIHSILVNDISEIDHAYQGKEIEKDYYYKLENKIIKFGFTIPIVLYKDNGLLKICDGWHRWKIAKKIGLSKIPCVIFESLEECKPTDNLKW